ncbi:zinc-binding alcohol dehydrogenase family protein [Chryseolinea sp. H1M3-3]|uniref:zinc-binding alcohol dehydrogenase family protein n=1 Tax=Chryseolinea sp. H1M3-3 TaxID=3034144 RepID=UPI0023EE168D|nr:zinc-binding alcohol dehydrogenase family protein [Chryseolinea sp. H1M3-3]
MKTLVCAQPRKFEYRYQPTPELIKDHSIIKIKRVGVCGTDLHAFEGTQPFLSYPRILGHELSGELIAGINAPGFELNEVVSFMPYFNCGECIACRSGRSNCCVRLQVCGVHIDGGMAEYVLVPSKSLLHAQGLSLDEMALVEPLAIGAHGVRRAAVEPGEFVLVVGTGPIGMGAIEFARIAGGKVIALDLNERRLQFCKNKLGVSHTVNALEPDVDGRLREITNGDMPTVVIDATGSLKAINNAFKFMAHGGRFVLIGLQRGDISFSHPEFHKREGTLMSSRNATREDFEHVISSLKNGAIRPSTYITHRASFNNVITEFEGWLNPGSGVIKAMIDFD